MNFTNEQRFIIAMIADLYRKPENRQIQTKDIDMIMDAISSGHDWGIDWAFNGLFPEETDSKSDVDFVVDVLDMWQFIETGFEALPEADKQKVRDSDEFMGVSPKFAGFDGNNESNLMAIARFLIHRLDRFTHFAKRELNSHAPKSTRYRQMLMVWSGIRPKLGDRRISVDDLIALLARN